MKYEIITDDFDLLVLTVNSRVIEVSHDKQVIIDKFIEDYSIYLDRKKKAVLKELSGDTKETKSVNTIGGETTKDKKPDAQSLGKLFGL